MQRKIELLAPGGDLDSIKAAIVAGADAIYCGLNNFNARNRATNLELDDLTGIIALAHRHDCQIFLTLNIIIVESEIRALVNLLSRLVNSDIDGVIIQDLGLFYLLKMYFKDLKIHASTQLTTHNAGQLKFLSKLGAVRANLSRELDLKEIKELTLIGHRNGIQSEVFVHGSNCLSFSGICYMSSVQDGKSGNRGRCSQPCREQYLRTPVGKDFPLNLKDNSAFNDLQALSDAGVDSVKIEGRVKKFHYVYTVVKSWRNLLDQFYRQDQSPCDNTDLYQAFNRDFSNAFLKGAIDKEMFIDNPRDNSARHFAEIMGRTTAEGLTTTKQEIHAARTEIITAVSEQIADLDIAKSRLKMRGDPKTGAPLKVSPPATARRPASAGLQPLLSVIVSSMSQWEVCADSSADIYFQLPDSFRADTTEYVSLFSENEELTPWFPSILIGSDFAAAVDILTQARPKRIVTNNTGIAYEACRQGIPWIAGPCLNTVNSFSLVCLKEYFNCAGAFISNELSRQQIQNIVPPENFALYYSIYHPIELLTSRQCLHYQVEGCAKSLVDGDCLHGCQKSSTITNLKDAPLFVEKRAGCYQRIYHHLDFLNTEIVADMPDKFSSFFIELSAVQTATQVSGDKSRLVETFEALINGQSGAKAELEKMLCPTTHVQYEKGIN